MEDWREQIQNLANPLEPLPTSQEPILRPPTGIRCLALDVYGTLLISERQKDARIVDQLRQQYGFPEPQRTLGDLIREEHQLARTRGIAFPEVDIRELWQKIFPGKDIERFALHYEMLVNRVWPMPGLKIPKSIPLALVSNGQFYTPLILDALLSLKIAPRLAIYSYQHRQAKPGTFLFLKLKEELALREIKPSEVLYVGNDHEKDIVPAKAVGFQTVLFAGDARSFHYRQNLPQPDSLITELSQLSSHLGVS